MTSYLLTFTVYTTAMIGMIFIALVAYQKFSGTKQKSSNSKFLQIEDCINIGMRKQLYVVKAGNEKFLIASDAERTTFLSKLNNSAGSNISEITDLSFEEVNRSIQKNRNMEVELSDEIFSEEKHIRKDSNAILRNIIGAKK